MEKNIASHDLSDMMVYEGMEAQSRDFHSRQRLTSVQRIVEPLNKAYEHLGRFAKRKMRASGRSVYDKEIDFSNTATAIYSITVASVLISFFWLTLLLSPTA
jgi:hypothetical protein